ncbi:transposase [Methanohalophilus sp. WG1-DM]|uniref:transposase n=1 Tax=Methanohalophilus sp. WG1-DM TaxID=2491675 RepID=UPI0037438CC3
MQPFRSILKLCIPTRTDKEGRFKNDVVMMLKMFLVQQWHGLSAPELEHQCIDCISFRKFRGFPRRMPDDTTVWA